MVYGTQGVTPLGASAAKAAGVAALRKYNPDIEGEPRVPAGNAGGGEWTTGGAEDAPSTMAPMGLPRQSISPVTTAQLTIPWDLPADIPLEIPGAPTEITPVPFDFPGAERQRPPLPTNPFPRDPKCAEEWANAYKYCDRMQKEGKFQPGYAGPGKDLRSCLLGQVSERCGGNPVG